MATVSIISLSNARAKSRDAKRAGDIKQVQTALELFFNDNGRYPTSTEWATGQIFSTSSSGTSTYMQVIPSAPTPVDGNCTANQNTFYYTQTENGNSYTISLCLGNTTGTITAGPKCLTPGGIVDADCSSGGGLPADACGGVSSVDYAGENYPVVVIGDQCWFAKNLNVGAQIIPWGEQADNGIIEKYCYEGYSGNGDGLCDTYGGMYQWYEAIQYINGASPYVEWDPVPTGNIQGICPTGWHLPSDSVWPDVSGEWRILEQGLATDPNCNSGASGCPPAGAELQVGGSSGFEGLMGGYLDFSYGMFDGLGWEGGFWSALPYGGGNPYAYLRWLIDGQDGIMLDYLNANTALSVRCVKD